MFKNTLISLSAAVVLGLSSAGLAQANDPADAAMQQALAALDATLPGKLINNPYDIQWSTDGSDKKEAIVKSEGVPGGMAYSVRVKKAKRKPWETATRFTMTEDIAKDDVILISYWARAAKPQKGRDTGDILVALQRNIEPYDSIVEERVDLGTEWKLRYAAGTAKRDYVAEKTNLNFNLAYAKQTIEFGQFYIMNLGPNGDPSKYLSKN